jgi:murein DD-endopeptidase MepM/ murein hydrolase activator NlpD
MTADQALAQVGEFGWKIDRQDQYDDATVAGQVIRQDPPPGSKLKEGATFSVVYESLAADGEPVTWGNASAGRVLAAEFVNKNAAYSAMWFKDGEGKGSYFGLDGQSKQRTLLSSPLEFSRVTSGFAMRMHPILNTWKQHNGVDYGAPQGTPVRTVGDGVVEFAGWQNGYGNVVHVKHNGDLTTVYAHLSRIEVRKGQHVDQGQSLGAVGMTGWATGPHLHFELKVHDLQVNPLKAELPMAEPLAAAQLASFAMAAAPLREQLALLERVNIALDRPR